MIPITELGSILKYYKGWEDSKNKKSGFFPLDKPKFCSHPDHYVPSHLYIPQGQGYRHVCPACGNVIEVFPQQIFF